MNGDNYKDILINLIPVIVVICGGIGTIVGYCLKAFFEKRNERELRKFNRKEEQYRKFLNLALLGFFDGWEEKGKSKKFLKELNTNALLYASDEVLKKIWNYLDCFDKKKDNFPEEKKDEYFKELVIFIRKELMKLQGDKTELKPEDIEIRKLNE